MNRGSLGTSQDIGLDPAEATRFQEPVLTRAAEKATQRPRVEVERASMHIRFEPGDLVKELPKAIMWVQLPDEFFHLTYEMHVTEQDQISGVVDQIRENYARQTRIANQLEGVRGLAPVAPDTAKTPLPSLSNQVFQLLRCQEYIEMAAVFEDPAERDERQAQKLTLLLQKLNDWYVEGIGAIREQLRTKRDSLGFVRELINSGSEILIDLGIRLAREPSIRAAVQQDLVEIYLNLRLSDQIRQRAFAYLQTHVREGLADDRLAPTLAGDGPASFGS